jgi:ketopantoate hydroxymethyltransferase
VTRQVLVLYDLLGPGRPLQPAASLRKYADLSGSVTAAVDAFGRKCGKRTYPGKEHSFE